MIDFFFENVNSIEYYDYMMNDLAIILDEDQIEINEFFEVSQAEKKDTQTIFCNIELSFNEIELPVFSDQQHEYQRIFQFYDFHN